MDKSVQSMAFLHRFLKALEYHLAGTPRIMIFGPYKNHVPHMNIYR